MSPPPLVGCSVTHSLTSTWWLLLPSVSCGDLGMDVERTLVKVYTFPADILTPKRADCWKEMEITMIGWETAEQKKLFFLSFEQGVHIFVLHWACKLYIQPLPQAFKNIFLCKGYKLITASPFPYCFLYCIVYKVYSIIIKYNYIYNVVIFMVSLFFQVLFLSSVDSGNWFYFSL